MSLDFTAIDFETANPKRASACAVGLARVRDGRIVDVTATLIKPPAAFGEFSDWNTQVHGITAAMVADAPPWRQVAAWIGSYAGGDLLVAHNAPFEMSVLRQACEAERIPVPAADFICTLALSRACLQQRSHKLPDVAAALGITFTGHHDASADARCAAQIAVAMSSRHGHDKLEQFAQSLGVAIARLDSHG